MWNVIPAILWLDDELTHPNQIANWLPRPGRAKVTYPGGSTFEGTFNGERIREGEGKYIWIKPTEEDDEDPQVLSSICWQSSFCRSRQKLEMKLVYHRVLGLQLSKIQYEDSAGCVSKGSTVEPPH